MKPLTLSLGLLLSVAILASTQLLRANSVQKSPCPAPDQQILQAPASQTRIAVRGEANTDATIKGYANSGEPVCITNYDEELGWIYIQVQTTGLEGWVPGKAIQRNNNPPTEETSAPSNRFNGQLVGWNATDSIELRAEPTAQAPILLTAKVADGITVLENLYDDQGQQWFKLQHPHLTQAAWVRSDQIQVNSDLPLLSLPVVGRIKFQGRYTRANTTVNLALDDAIKNAITQGSGDRTHLIKNTRYFYHEVDLNGDGLVETLVYLLGSSTCGTGGCNLLIFQATEAGYKLVSNHTLVRAPLVVSETRTQGWRDLVLFVAGGGIAPDYYVLKFNGQTYPSNPSTAPLVPEGSVMTGEAIIADDIFPGMGAPLLVRSP